MSLYNVVILVLIQLVFYYFCPSHFLQFLEQMLSKSKKLVTLLYGQNLDDVKT